jgi:two-component system chemotaxis response regulator CheB
LKDKIKVLIVEDSVLMVNVITEMLESDPRLEVIGSARNGEEGIKKVFYLNPDVVTLDMEMPVMDGLEFIKYIMKKKPLPIIMLSAYTTPGAEETVKALELGALDFVSKPTGSISLNIREVKAELIRKIVLASNIKEEKLKPVLEKMPPAIKYKPVTASEKVVLICSSTGGPKALAVILLALPKDLRSSILIIQHMPQQFTPLLARRLDRISPLRVKEVEGGERITNGVVYVAAGGKHLEVGKDNKIVLSDKPKKHGVRPSCDVAMRSLKNFSGSVLAVILTGMGKDGSDSIYDVKKIDGQVIVEDESTSVIFGMPKAAIKTGCVDKIVPLYDIPKEIIKFAQ